MINPNIDSIIYQSQIYYRDLVNQLTDSRAKGFSLEKDWDKADLIYGYLDALGHRSNLTDPADIDNLNYILECLIKLCELNEYPIPSPITFQAAPALVAQKGDKGDTGDIGPQGPTGFTTDFSVISTSVGIVVDSFPIASAKAAEWKYLVVSSLGAQRVSSILGQWTPDGLSHEVADSGTDDLVGDTSGIEFDVSISGSTVQLVAIITSGTWSITGSRQFIPSNGNGSGPITNVLPLGQIYIGNASNQATATPVTGVIQLSTAGVTSYAAGSILDAAINSGASIALTKLASLNNNIVPITNGSGKLISSTLSPTTLAFVDIGSSLTGLLNAKLTDPLTTIGDIIYRNGSNLTSRLGIGSVSQVLTVVGGVPAWQNVPGGISGLTTGFLPKASSATTLTNSIISETTGAIVIAGTGEIQGGFRTQASGPYLKRVVINIGDWNMDTTTTATIAHGLGSIKDKVREVSVFIRNDADTLTLPIGYGSFTSGLSQGWVNLINNTNIVLNRVTGGAFDDPTYSATSYNRGWITVTYEV